MGQSELDLFQNFLRFPSVSTLDSHLSDMSATREWLIKYLSDLGFTTQLLPAVKHPAIFAQRFVDPTYPTVLIYGHYDVQPPDPLDQWITPPFEPTIKAGEIYARGATDDKGQLMVHLLAVKQLISSNSSPVNFKFYIEGEEEIGSPSVADQLTHYPDLFACDYIVVSDTEMPQPGHPSIHIGLRGLLYTEISLQTASHDMHSGQFGGVVENAAQALVRLLNQLKDANNHVLITDFYASVAPLTPAEQADFSQLEPNPADILSDSSAFYLGGGEPHLPLNHRRWSQPTLDINGLTSGFTGEGTKTIIPAQASAKVSMRLVPNQDPNTLFQLFSDYVKTLSPAEAKVEVKHLASALPYKAPTSHPVFELAKSCLTAAFHHPTVYYATGGSIGFVPLLTQALKGVPCLLISLGNPGCNLHAPNEHFSLDNLDNGITAMVNFYSQLKK